MGNNRNPMSIYTANILLYLNVEARTTTVLHVAMVIQFVVKKERTHFCGRSRGQESLFKSKACRNETMLKAKKPVEMVETDTKKKKTN